MATSYNLSGQVMHTIWTYSDPDVIYLVKRLFELSFQNGSNVDIDFVQSMVY